MSNQPVLILVLSCRAHRDTRQRAVRETWAAGVPDGCRLLYVEGGATGPARIEADRLLVPVIDDYNHLAEKTFRAIEGALALLAFDGILKCDDDTYAHPARFAAVFDRAIPYAGSTRDTLSRAVRYAQGGAYWLSRAACERLVAQPFEAYHEAEWFLGRTRMRKRGERERRTRVSIEDYMVGDILNRQGITVAHDRRFNPDPFPSVHEDPELFTCHHVNPVTMRRIHRLPEWRRHPWRRLLIPLVRHLPASRKPR